MWFLQTEKKERVFSNSSGFFQTGFHMHRWRLSLVTGGDIMRWLDAGRRVQRYS
jgi:hypothetical protein